jgi:hypothetical protein
MTTDTCNHNLQIRARQNCPNNSIPPGLICKLKKHSIVYRACGDVDVDLVTNMISGLRQIMHRYNSKVVTWNCNSPWAGHNYYIWIPWTQDNSMFLVQNHDITRTCLYVVRTLHYKHRFSNSCSTSSSLVTETVISHEWGQNQGERVCRTQFWKGTIQWLFHQSLVLIELVSRQDGFSVNFP